MTRTMKPKPFENLIQEARDLGIDPFAAGEFGPDNAQEISNLKAKIAVRAARGAEADEAVEQNREEPVMIRVVEWTQWLPATDIEVLVTGVDPRSGQPQFRPLPMHNGITGFVTDKNEKVLEVGVQATGQTKTLDTDEIDEESGEPNQQMYGLYVFQAVLATNVSANFLTNAIKAQDDVRLELEEKARKKREDEGRDKRSDLLVVEGGQTVPNTPPNRKERRHPKKKGGKR